MKKGKAAGVDGKPAELLTAGQNLPSKYYIEN